LNLKISRPVKVFFSPEKDLLQSIKNIFGFYPENIFLYKLAFRHKSVAEETFNGVKISNERLEYLGDAILSAVIADFLFKKFPFKDEGFLTEMRAKIVSRTQLNNLSYKLGIDQLIYCNKEVKSHNRSMNGDAFEAFIGAIYIDKGYNFTKKIIINRIINYHINIDELENKELNFKSKLIEWSQKEKKSVEFILKDEIGEGFNKQHVIEVFVDNKPVAVGMDFSIKKAEQNAAEKAYNQLQEEETIQ
jgi:ribonuclease-3